MNRTLNNNEGTVTIVKEIYKMLGLLWLHFLLVLTDQVFNSCKPAGQYRARVWTCCVRATYGKGPDPYRFQMSYISDMREIAIKSNSI